MRKKVRQEREYVFVRAGRGRESTPNLTTWGQSCEFKCINIFEEP